MNIHCHFAGTPKHSLLLRYSEFLVENEGLGKWVVCHMLPKLELLVTQQQLPLTVILIMCLDDTDKATNWDVSK